MVEKKGCGFFVIMGAIFVLYLISSFEKSFDKPSKKEIPQTFHTNTVVKNQQPKEIKPPLDEKDSILRSKFFGDLSQAKKIKKSGKIILMVWEPYIKYAQSLPNPSIKSAMLSHTNDINIDYDEIWIKIFDDLFNADEKKRFKGQFDINTIYWKDNKIQASTIEKYYVSNPITGTKIGKHQITGVWDRDSILKEISN
ncbi:hypothetical protein [Desulfobacca acetoxidans]